MALVTQSERRGEDLSWPVQFFLPNLPGVYGWVSRPIFGGGQSVKQIGCVGSRPGQQADYLSGCLCVYFMLFPLKQQNFWSPGLVVKGGDS